MCWRTSPLPFEPSLSYDLCVLFPKGIFKESFDSPLEQEFLYSLFRGGSHPHEDRDTWSDLCTRPSPFLLQIDTSVVGVGYDPSTCRGRVRPTLVSYLSSPYKHRRYSHVLDPGPSSLRRVGSHRIEVVPSRLL